MAESTIYVKIRTWDSMSQEYGTKHLDPTIIEIPKSFTKQMEDRMPGNRIIEVQTRTSTDSYIWRCGGDMYFISEQMIEQKYDTSIIIPTKDTKISEPVCHMKNSYYISTDGGYLHSDMIIRTSIAPLQTGCYPTEQSALFAKLRFERLQQKGLLHDFSKPINPYQPIPVPGFTCSS